jgi:HemY protein
MIKFLILLAILFGLAFGFHWLKALSGEVTLTLGETAYVTQLTTAILALVVGLVVLVALFWFLRELIRSPGRLFYRFRLRNAERGRAAVSRGLLAVAAGDLRAAERSSHEAARRAPELPLTRLLQAQTAQLRGDRDTARRIFQAMTEDPETRIAGLRGLHIEAEREGEHEAARLIAAQAREEAPATPWAARAMLRHQTAAGDWEGALRTLSGAVDGRILDKRTARRQRAVILAAEALAREEGDPERARQAALEAHDLAPDLVPAAVAAGRLLSRQGDIRRAARVLERTWKEIPHPELAEAYLHVRPGDSASDRLKRAETLQKIRPQADEGRLAVARAAIDAREFGRAREALAPVLTTRPTQRALIIMAELEEAETGDRGRAREWLARAVRAPRDPAWTADGMVLEAWAPVSPASGRLDAVDWKVPLTELEGPTLEIDPREIEAPPAPPVAPVFLAAEPPAKPPEEAQKAPMAPAGRGEGAVVATAARGEATVRKAPESTPASIPASMPASIIVPPPHGAAAPRKANGPHDPTHPIPDDPGVEPAEAEEERRAV